MVNEYRVRMRKEQRPEVAEKHPNLAAAPVYLNVTKFYVEADLRKATDKQIKKLLKSELESVSKRELNPKYHYGKKEELVVVHVMDTSTPVFDDEIKLPKHLRDEKEEKVEN